MAFLGRDTGDSDRVMLLALLCLNAAFDTVDHDNLLARSRTHEIARRPLDWLCSFMDGRAMMVTIGSHPLILNTSRPSRA